MENHPLQSLIHLIEFDREIIKKEHVLEDINNHIAQLKQEETHLVEHHEEAQHLVHKAKKAVHEYELTMKELDEKEKEKKKLLEETDSQKVYENLKKEINFLKKSQYDHEKKLVQCWKELEAAQKSFEDEEAKFTSKKSELSTQQENELKKATEINKELKELYTQRKDKETKVPEEWITKYNMMRTQTDNPIVRVEYGSCGGCFAQLPPQDLLDLKRKKLLQCSSCYRFIYLPEELEEEPLKKQTEERE